MGRVYALQDACGRFIRHANLMTDTAESAGTIAMVELRFERGVVAPSRLSPALSIAALTTEQRTVALAPIAAFADHEQG
ncbi:hypothetical protein WDW37_12595 [Bdellovibrionota bacterium FG-1]